MKWFKHESGSRNKLEMKLIRTHFGAEGYGVYIALKEVVAEYVEKENVSEWGLVHPLHTIETLAVECATTPERLKEILEFCDEKGILKKKDGRLYDTLIFDQLDNFFERVKKDTTKSVRSNYVPTTDIEENRRDKKRKEEKRKEYDDKIKNPADFSQTSSLINSNIGF